MTDVSLPLEPGRSALLRLDTARVLKRFFHLERALALACAGWVPGVARLESKALLAHASWQDAMTAGSLRERVFELRYPDRSLDTVGDEAQLVRLFAAALHAPSGGALLLGLARVLVPWLGASYEAYLEASDDVVDGPTRRFLRVAVEEKSAQGDELEAAGEAELRAGARPDAERWVEALGALLVRLGGPGLDGPRPGVEVPDVVSPGRPFALAQQPARDERYFSCSFYWPDIVDPAWPYGEGLRLQLRSAVSHLNEVWAVETAGAILVGLADALGWDFVHDAARWLYDESRHMAMGRRRLEWWSLDPAEVPLGSYIYEACRGQDAVTRLGMLAFFETKNIGRKRERADELGRLGDRTSQRDMDFDWADEAIHTGYGRRWLRRALQASGRDPESWPEVVARCEELVRERVARATPEEVDAIRAQARRLIEIAERRAAAP
ncbi:MAG TPA: DUF455 family protein [Actinomycetota bacterium]|nr:DUF455 family protein [Actinomycetota bacterium]